MTAHEALVQTLCDLAAPVCEQLGVELVELHLSGPSRNRRIRVDVDRPGPRGVDLGDCQRVSEALGDALEQADPLPDRYRLEVSSPGIDRPIRSADDIRRNTGRRVCVTTSEPVGDRSCFRGLLVGLEGGTLLLDEAGDDGAQRARIPLERIEKTLQDTPF